MKIFGVNLPEKHKIVFAGDMHFGTMACHTIKIQEMIERIRNEENTFLVLMGDQLDSITKKDKRHDDTVVFTPTKQANMFSDMFEPIKDRVIAVLAGNHEMTLANQGFGNLVEDTIAPRLNAVYANYASVMTVNSPSGKFLYRAYMWHGKHTMNSRAGSALKRQTNWMEQMKGYLWPQCGDANVMVMGHAHKVLIYPPTLDLYLGSRTGKLKKEYYIPEYTGENIHPDHRWYACSGSFLKQYVEGEITYGEVHGFPPVDMGYVTLDTYQGKVNMDRVVV